MKKLLVSLLLAFSFFSLWVKESQALDLNLRWTSYKAEWAQVRNNDVLDLFWDGFIQVGTGGEKWIYYSLIRIARDMKNFFFIAATIYFMIIVIKVLLSDHTSEEVEKFKKGIIWITVGIVVMQMAYAFVKIIYDQGVWEAVAFNIVDWVINPLIRLLELLTSVFFLAMMFFAFYRMITSNGEEESLKKAKNTILYAFIWFFIVRFAKAIVETVYGKAACTQVIWGIIQINSWNCINPAQISWAVNIVVSIINWLNGFVGIAVVLMILYAGFTIFTSAGDEEKVKKAKKIIIYVIVWMLILVVNWLILTFFILPEKVI